MSRLKEMIQIHEDVQSYLGFKTIQTDVDSWMSVKMDGTGLTEEDLIRFNRIVSSRLAKSRLNTDMEFPLSTKIVLPKGAVFVQDSKKQPDLSDSGKYYFRSFTVR